MTLNPLIEQYKIYIILAALAALVIGEFFFVRDIYVTECDAKIAKISLENEKANTKNLEKIRITEAELTKTKGELENQNVKSKEDLSKANAMHADYVRKYGLRDPGKPKATNSMSSDSGNSSCPSGSDDNNLISGSASEFLLSLTKEADSLRIDYKTCMDWMAQVKTILDKSK